MLRLLESILCTSKSFYALSTKNSFNFFLDLGTFKMLDIEYLEGQSEG